VHIAEKPEPSATPQRRIKALASCALFADLPPEALSALAERSRWLRFSPGEAVVNEGDASRALYVNAEGTATVDHGGQELSRLGPGEVFGEMAYLSGEPRSATVRAATALKVVEVDNAGLAALLEEHRHLADELARRVASRQQELETCTEEGSPARPRVGLVSHLRDCLLRLVGAERDQEN
jgi:CRP-like cAMP-binding protein